MVSKESGSRGDNKVSECLIGDWADYLIWHQQHPSSY